MKTILVPVDFSSAGESVVTAAIQLARAIRGRVVLLHVVQPPLITTEYSPMIEDIASLTIAAEKAAARLLARLQKKIRHEIRSVATQQFTGLPVAHILEQAEKLSADYIILGSHGHTALYDLLVGSTTHGVLKQSPCPVVVVPPGKKQPRLVRRQAKAA